MKSTQIFALANGFLGVALAQTAYYGAQPTPMPCKGDACVDPGLTLRYQDTTIIRQAGKQGTGDLYFRFSKGDNPVDGTWHLNYTILGDLSNITKSDCVSGAYKSSNFPNSDLNRWAPEVHFFNNQYYLFYTVENQKTGACFDQCVATSPSMDAGTWTDHGTMKLPDDNHAYYRRIDGNILADASDPQGAVSPFMAFNSWGAGIYGIELASDYLTAKAGDPKLLIASQNQPSNGTSGNEHRTEGAFQLRNNGFIYLFYSRGSCCSGPDVGYEAVYRTQVCRTNATTPFGPYYDRDGHDCTNGPATRNGSTILYPTNRVFEPGSVSVLKDPTLGLIMTYQYADLTSKTPYLGFGWNYLAWGKDGWPILTQTR